MATVDLFNYNKLYSTYDRYSIKNFVIYGERHSGTTWISNSILNTFNIPLAGGFDHKHFFGCCNWNLLNNAHNTLFIGIIRNIYSWIKGMNKKPYHLETKDVLTLKPWSSTLPSEIICDRNWYNKEKYIDIFDMRYHKLYFLYYIMPYLVDNYIFIRYEDFIDKYKFIIAEISNLYELPVLYPNYISADVGKLSIPKLSTNQFEQINNNTVWEMENTVGYRKLISVKDTSFSVENNTNIGVFTDRIKLFM